MDEETEEDVEEESKITEHVKQVYEPIRRILQKEKRCKKSNKESSLQVGTRREWNRVKLDLVFNAVLPIIYGEK